MFSHLEADDNRRPDILVRNPHGGGSQAAVEVAISSFDSSTRTNNNKPEQVLIASEKQKTRKYGKVAEENQVRLCPMPSCLLYNWRNGPEYQKSLPRTNQTKITISRW